MEILLGPPLTVEVFVKEKEGKLVHTCNATPALGKMNYFPELSVWFRRAVVIGAILDVPLSATIAARCSVLEQGHISGREGVS